MKRTQAEQINAAIRQAGVVWHACDHCGRDWPFPTGSTMVRDWRCAACVNALLAAWTRQHVAPAPEPTP